MAELLDLVTTYVDNREHLALPALQAFHPPLNVPLAAEAQVSPGGDRWPEGQPGQ